MACRGILLQWKSPNPTSTTSWLNVFSVVRKGEIILKRFNCQFLQKMAAYYLICKYSYLSGPQLIFSASILLSRHLEHSSYCTSLLILFDLLFVYVFYLVFFVCVHFLLCLLRIWNRWGVGGRCFISLS